MIWESFGGWFNNDPAWKQRLDENKYDIIRELELTEKQLDKIVQLFIEKDILRMN